jgi:hypothetical protein
MEFETKKRTEEQAVSYRQVLKAKLCCAAGLI